jgi:hypothetical protein
MRKYLILLLALTALISGCATNYYSYSGSGVLIGQGGASTMVSGIELWITGTPPRKYRVIGYIEDSRPGGPLAMVSRNSQVAAKARSQGGDAVILGDDQSQIVGSISTGNAFASSNGYFGSASFFGTSAPIVRRTGRYYVIKYI